VTIRLATWNVNSIKARLPIVRDWVAANGPEIVCLQEIKTVEFPNFEFEALGYHCLFVGQKSYNGVAILSKLPVKCAETALPEGDGDDHARFIAADIDGLHIINIYLPNGNPIGTEKFMYKLAWMDRLQRHLKKLLDAERPFVIGGDFNIIPEDIDCYDPRAWKDDALFQPESRGRYRALLNMGLTDALRAVNPNPHVYTFWDYQAGRWQRDQGIRIDHWLLCPEAADRLENCVVDKAPRGLERASDHTPVILTLRD
jgi:exodeoxyribonuclease-3